MSVRVLAVKRFATPDPTATELSSVFWVQGQVHDQASLGTLFLQTFKSSISQGLVRKHKPVSRYFNREALMEGLAFLGVGGCKSAEDGNPETVTVEEATIHRTGEEKEEAGVIRTLTFGGGAQGAGAWTSEVMAPPSISAAGISEGRRRLVPGLLVSGSPAADAMLTRTTCNKRKALYHPPAFHPLSHGPLVSPS